MAPEDIAPPERPVTAITDLVAYTKQQLEEHAKDQAKLQAASAGELPSESQGGATLDFSNRSLKTLPLDVILLIKERVER